MAVVHQAPTQAEQTKGTRKDLRDLAIEAFMVASDADPEVREDEEALREMICARLGVDTLDLKLEDAISDLKLEAARPVATAAYHAVFSHVPALYINDADYAAQRDAEIEAGR